VVEIPLPRDFESVKSVSWHPDGTAITFTDSSGEATFDPDTGEQIGSRLSLRGQGQADAAIWKPDGEHLLGAGTFGISEWEFATGERRSPVDRDVPTERMDLAPEADLLVTLDTAGQVWFWDLQSRSSIGGPMPNQRLGSLQDLWTFVGVDGAGSYASLDGGDGTIIWNLDPAVWREAACAAAGRNMTRDEWSRTMSGESYGPTCEPWPAAPG
jgi:hypothetical protein